MTKELDIEHWIDARPKQKFGKNTSWDRAIQLRDEAKTIIEEFLQQQQIRATIITSNIGAYPAWVRLEAHVDETGGATIGHVRCSLLISFKAKPYHRFDVVIDVAAKCGRHTYSRKNQFLVGRNDLMGWCNFTIGRGNIFENRDSIWDFVKNAFWGKHRKPINEILKVYSQPDNSSYSGPVCRSSVFLPKRPRFPPMDIFPVDSWSIVLRDIGQQATLSEKRFIDELENSSDDALQIVKENYTQSSSTGFEQRERVVVVKGQAVVHLHVYKYGSDLYVGWVSYLNWADWGDGKKKFSKRFFDTLIEYRDLVPSAYVPNHFDLIDLSSLSEFVHWRVEKIVKILIEENKIDQEVDFHVIRGDRDDAIDEDKHSNKLRKKRRWRYKG